MHISSKNKNVKLQLKIMVSGMKMALIIMPIHEFFHWSCVDLVLSGNVIWKWVMTNVLLRRTFG